MKLSGLYGCTRYFYPTSHIEDLDWHVYLQKKIQKVIQLSTTQEIDSFLLKEFSLFIPSLSIDYEYKEYTPLNIGFPYFVKENHLKTGYSKTIVESNIKQVRTAEEGVPAPGIYSFPISASCYIRYPLTVPNLPAQSPALKQVLKHNKMNWKKDFFISPYYRIANAIINNSFIQHFYAYYEEENLSSSWYENYKIHLAEVAVCSSYKDYLRYSYKHYAHIKDDHLFIMNGYNRPNALLGSYTSIYYPDITLAYVEGKICVTDYAAYYTNLRIGDEIISANNMPIEALIKQKLTYISASTTGSKYKKLCSMFLFQSFQKDSVIRIEVQGKDKIIRHIPLVTNKLESREIKKDHFVTEVNTGIWKINPCVEKGSSYANFCKYIDQFQEAKGVIIDLRGYPRSVIFPILAHFIDYPASVGTILTPTFYYPNHKSVKYQITPESQWSIYPATEVYQKEWEYERPLSIRIKTPVVFLIDYQAVSFSETIVELVKHHHIGPIVGTPTAGTNGDAVIARTPTVGYIFTGYKFLAHGEKKHHGIGILPDIDCPTTLKDLREQKDTQVVKACQLIESGFK